MATADCDSCGSPNQEVAAVQRLYFGQPGVSEDTLDADVEMWCVVCRTHYPHEAAL